MKRSISGLIWGLLAAAVFFVLYYAFTNTLTEFFSFIISNLRKDGDRELAQMFAALISTFTDLLLVCGIAQLALAVLGWLLRPFNTIMKIFAWFSLIFSGLLFFIPSLFAIIAGSCNSRSFKRMKEAAAE